jgi:uncharacterized RDD family membrane protein YckC
MIADQLSRQPRPLPIRREVNAFAQSSPAPVIGPQLDNRRVLAALVDLLVIGVGGFVLGLVVGLVNGTDAEWGGGMQAISLAWALYYYFAFESGDGQTLGKKLLKIRVIRADGGPAGMKEIAIRTVLRVVDGAFLYLVGLVIMLVTGQRRQRLGDIAAGTVVADASTGPAPKVNEATAAPPAAATPEGLDQPERVEDSEPVEKTPVDVGQPLEGLTPPQPAATPQVTDFEPFAPAAEEERFEQQEEIEQQEESAAEESFAEESFGEESVGAPQAADEPEPQAADDPEPQVADEPEPQVADEAEPQAFDAPAPQAFGEPAQQPVDEGSDSAGFETSMPGSESRTEWPHMYAARAQQAEAELSPQPQEPHIGDVAEPVEDLQADAARASAEPLGDTRSEVPGLAGPPVEESSYDETPAAEAEAAASEEPDEDVNVKSVETVSAIDLIMGADEQDDSEAPQPGAPDEADSGDDRPAGL